MARPRIRADGHTSGRLRKLGGCASLRSVARAQVRNGIPASQRIGVGVPGERRRRRKATRWRLRTRSWAGHAPVRRRENPGRLLRMRYGTVCRTARRPPSPQPIRIARRARQRPGVDTGLRRRVPWLCARRRKRPERRELLQTRRSRQLLFAWAHYPDDPPVRPSRSRQERSRISGGTDARPRRVTPWRPNRTGYSPVHPLGTRVGDHAAASGGSEPRT